MPVPQLAVLLALVAALAAPGAAAAQVQAKGTNDYGGFRDVLPPGNDATANALEAGGFLSGTAPPPRHFTDQLPLFRDLLYASPGLEASEIGRFFKSNAFGVAPGDVEREYRPGGRSDVTVLRDRGFGTPHVYGSTREGLMFGAGYVAAEDRLFFMDLLRHIGRASVASFLGGHPDYRQFDHDQWRSAPYRDEDFTRQIERLDEIHGASGRLAQRDLTSYAAGVNQYIAETRTDPSKMPAEYAAIGRPLGADRWVPEDIVASGAVIGAQLGTAGGDELRWATILGDFRRRFGPTRGRRLWERLQAPSDPESANTVLGRRFEWQPVPRRPRPGSAAVPDRGSLQAVEIVQGGGAPAAGGGGGALTAQGRRTAAALRALVEPADRSNAVLVAGRHSASGRPLAVFGPQTGFFTAEPLMLQDLHGPGVDAAGMSISGASLYVEIGRGRDFAWSATSAHNDLVDVFAVPLCDPRGGAPTTTSRGYRFRGRCESIEVLRRRNSWTPNALDQTPPGSEVLYAERTKMGLVTHRGTVRGRPVAFTRLRSTYMHEFDSAVAFLEMNDPAKVHDARTFQRAAAKVGYAFNWLYADDRDIAYINGGANNPVRPRGVDPLLPTWSRFEWRDFRPATNTARYAAFRQMPQVINQDYLVNWNNRQAPGYHFPDPGRTSVYRSEMLESRVRRALGAGKLRLEDVVDITMDAATVDLRGEEVLPELLRALGRPARRDLRDAVRLLRGWSRSGAHRIDRDRDGVYEDDAAVRLMDAWWPRLLRAQFEPVLGAELFEALGDRVELHNAPNYRGQHRGSAFETGWYGYVEKDLRTLRDPRRVRGRYPVVFCGRGSRSACRQALRRSLRAALAVPATELYGDDPGCAGLPPERLAPCYDEIRFQATTAVTVDPIPFQNRPTYQQVVEVQGHRPR